MSRSIVILSPSGSCYCLKMIFLFKKKQTKKPQNCFFALWMQPRRSTQTKKGNCLGKVSFVVQSAVVCIMACV